MASLKDMPAIEIDSASLKRWGSIWLGTQSSGKDPKNIERFDKKQSMDFGKEVIDPAIAKALAVMVGDVQIKNPLNRDSLLPPEPDCIEIGDARVIGGVRPQNFDVVYRPDGVRIAYDSKTLNDAESIGKNWQNMINDLATEATTVHTRFPYAIVIFVVVVPRQALQRSQEFDLIRTLERLGSRKGVLDQVHLAEAISFVVWDAKSGQIDHTVPAASSSLRLERLSEIITPVYLERYKGLPPHDKS